MDTLYRKCWQNVHYNVSSTNHALCTINHLSWPHTQHFVDASGVDLLHRMGFLASRSSSNTPCGPTNQEQHQIHLELEVIRDLKLPSIIVLPPGEYKCRRNWKNCHINKSCDHVQLYITGTNHTLHDLTYY